MLRNIGLVQCGVYAGPLGYRNRAHWSESTRRYGTTGRSATSANAAASRMICFVPTLADGPSAHSLSVC